MSGVYALMDTLLPFEWLHYTFMKNALIAIVLLTPLFGMLGTMAVDNKMAFFSDALGHSALTRIADRVIRVKNGTVIESSVNDAPLPVERIEW